MFTRNTVPKSWSVWLLSALLVSQYLIGIKKKFFFSSARKCRSQNQPRYSDAAVAEKTSLNQEPVN